MGRAVMERDPKGQTAKPRKQAAPSRTPERPRGGEARAIGDLMPTIGRTAFRRFGFVQSSVVSRWPEIVGPAHARHCAPESIRFPAGEKGEGTLHLVVSPGHAPLIQHVVPEIIERVNRFFGYRAVAQIRIRQGAVQAPRGTGAANRAKPVEVKPVEIKPVSHEVGDSLRRIGDPELRAVLESLARSLEQVSGAGAPVRAKDGNR